MNSLLPAMPWGVRTQGLSRLNRANATAPAGYLEPEAFGFGKGLLLRVSMTPRVDRLAGLIEQTIAQASVSAQATVTGGSLAAATCGIGAAGRACRPAPAAEFRIRLDMSTRSTLSL